MLFVSMWLYIIFIFGRMTVKQIGEIHLLESKKKNKLNQIFEIEEDKRSNCVKCLNSMGVDTIKLRSMNCC